MNPLLKRGLIITAFVFCFAIAFGQQHKIDSLKKALLSSKEDTNKVATLNRLANALANTSDLDGALPYYEQSLELSKKLTYHFGIAASQNYIGLVYMNKSAFPEALEFFFKSLEEAEKYNIKMGMAATMGNIGIMYENEKDYNKALRYHFKSLKIEEELGNLNGVAGSYNSIGNIYYYKGNSEKAIDCFNKALEIKIKLGDEEGCASSLANIGNIYYYQKDYYKTREYYFKALAFFEKLNDKQSVAMLSNNLAETYIAQKSFKEALKYSKKSLEMSTEIGSLDDIKSAYHTLSNIYEGLGDFKLALVNHRLYARFNDSIYNDENTRKAMETDIKYHFDKKAMNTRIENEKKQIIFKEEAKKQRLIIYFGAGILVLVIIFAAYAFRSFKVKQKINLQLSAQKEEIMEQRDEIELQRSIVEEKNKGLTDSINYAKRIQYTLLAKKEFLKENLPQHFIYFNPKDIISGDFYWATKKSNKFFLAVCDSTGHGVPGAFMSLLNIGFLSEAINEKGIESPEKILNYARERLIESVSKEGQRDGFDGVLICIEDGSNNIKYASAHNNPILIKDKSIIELPYDKMPVGFNESTVSFNLHSVEVKKGDTLYLFTDGFADQFGGDKGKKFMYKRLKELLVSVSSEPMDSQKQKLSDALNNWRGNLEQVDDICIIGVKI
ncbi:MAG TPA: tetratricopeptide repeat protein [Bacteroidia bacterium]|jgi:serine phosphatase RsbU (regulator of sigma subunit)|nr:tetratricopeptide repeat protein [Bacteroidia bacterium]